MQLDDNQAKALSNLGGGWPADVAFLRLFPTVSDSVRELHVNPTTGSDDNDGLTEATSLKSVQLACNLFKNPYTIQTWESGDDRTVLVHGNLGDEFEESIMLYPHAGQGALRIVGDYTKLEEGLVIDPAGFSAVAGYETVNTLALTGANMVPNTYLRNAICKPQVGLNALEFENTYDNLPIVDNGVSDLTLEILEPLSFGAFSYQTGALVDVVVPNVTWRPAPTDPSSFTQPTTIVSMGGLFIVEGFNVERQAGIAGFSSNFFESVQALGQEISSTGNFITACIFGEKLFTIALGAGVNANGCIFNNSSTQGQYFSRGMASVSLNNCISNNSILFFDGPGRLTIYGLLAFRDAGGFGGVAIQSVDKADLYMDIRATAGVSNLRVTQSSRNINLWALSVEGSQVISAVQVTGNSVLDIGSAAAASALNGTFDNDTVGMLIEEGSTVYGRSEANITLSGLLGDKQVGNAGAITTWISGVSVSLPEFARYST